MKIFFIHFLSITRASAEDGAADALVRWSFFIFGTPKMMGNIQNLSFAIPQVDNMSHGARCEAVEHSPAVLL